MLSARNAVRRRAGFEHAWVVGEDLLRARRAGSISSAAAAENAPETRTTCLKQDKNNYRYTENNLYYPDCR